MKEVVPYLRHILQECDFLIENSKELSYDDFIKDDILKRAFVRSLEVIGEAARKIPEEFTRKYPRIPWAEMWGMRNKLIHDYFGVNYTIVWETVKRDIPELIKQIGEILKEMHDS